MQSQVKAERKLLESSLNYRIAWLVTRILELETGAVFTIEDYDKYRVLLGVDRFIPAPLVNSILEKYGLPFKVESIFKRSFNTWGILLARTDVERKRRKKQKV